MARKRSKSQTRSELVEAAFRELADQSLDGLTIRQLTASVGLSPAAFYRHFADLDEIALVLVDEALHHLAVSLRGGLRDLDEDNSPVVIASLAASFQTTVDVHRAPMTFIARERYSGRAVARRAIQDGLRMVSLELAAELRSRTRLADWSWDDLMMFADAMVQIGIRYIEQLIQVSPDSPRRDELASVFYRQAFLLAYGADAFLLDTSPTTPVPANALDDHSKMRVTHAEGEPST